MSYIVYSLIHDEEVINVDEKVVRDAIENSENIYGDSNTNTIGLSDSFMAGENNQNIFYSYGE